MDIGKRVKQAREHLSSTKNRRVTQNDLAEICGWANGQTRIANYEKNIRTPSSEDLKKISKATGCRVEWLQFGTGPMLQGQEKTENNTNTDAPNVDIECLAQSLEALDYLEDRYSKIKNHNKKAEILWELYKINKENMESGEPPIDTSNVVRLAKLLA